MIYKYKKENFLGKRFEIYMVEEALDMDSIRSDFSRIFLDVDNARLGISYGGIIDVNKSGITSNRRLGVSKSNMPIVTSVSPPKINLFTGEAYITRYTHICPLSREQVEDIKSNVNIKIDVLDFYIREIPLDGFTDSSLRQTCIFLYDDNLYYTNIKIKDSTLMLELSPLKMTYAINREKVKVLL
jgi:hypothetical protein